MIGWGDPSQPLHGPIGSIPKKIPSAALCSLCMNTKKGPSPFWQVFMFQFHVIRTIFPLPFFWRPQTPKEGWDKPTEMLSWSLSHAVRRGQNRETPKNHRLQSPFWWFVQSSSTLVAMVVSRQWLFKDKRLSGVFKGGLSFGDPWAKANHCF